MLKAEKIIPYQEKLGNISILYIRMQSAKSQIVHGFATRNTRVDYGQQFLLCSRKRQWNRWESFAKFFFVKRKSVAQRGLHVFPLFHTAAYL